MTRLLNFDNILNARDFGGYEGHSGKSLARSRLFRTAHLSNASGEDLTRLRDMDVRLIVDLRYLSERERQPNRWPENTATKTLAFDARRTGQAPHEAFMQHDLRKPEDAIDYMLNNYSARPHSPEFQAIFKDTLHHMAETGDALIVHCAAGKDRTGTLVSLIQSILGVSDADIMDDYMMTMKAVDIDSLLEPAAKAIGKRFGRVYDPEALRPMFGVRPEYLEASLAAMGDGTTFAKDILGLDTAQIAAIQERYLA